METDYSEFMDALKGNVHKFEVPHEFIFIVDEFGVWKAIDPDTKKVKREQNYMRGITIDSDHPNGKKETVFMFASLNTQITKLHVEPKDAVRIVYAGKKPLPSDNSLEFHSCYVEITKKHETETPVKASKKAK